MAKKNWKQEYDKGQRNLSAAKQTINDLKQEAALAQAGAVDAALTRFLEDRGRVFLGLQSTLADTVTSLVEKIEEAKGLEGSPLESATRTIQNLRAVATNKTAAVDILVAELNETQAELDRVREEAASAVAVALNVDEKGALPNALRKYINRLPGKAFMVSPKNATLAILARSGTDMGSMERDIIRRLLQWGVEETREWRKENGKEVAAVDEVLTATGEEEIKSQVKELHGIDPTPEIEAMKATEGSEG